MLFHYKAKAEATLFFFWRGVEGCHRGCPEPWGGGLHCGRQVSSDVMLLIHRSSAMSVKCLNLFLFLVFPQGPDTRVVRVNILEGVSLAKKDIFGARYV